MAKVSELKKVQLLEEVILENDPELVQALFDEYLVLIPFVNLRILFSGNKFN